MERSLTRLLMTKISRAELTISRSPPAVAFTPSSDRPGRHGRPTAVRGPRLCFTRGRRASPALCSRHTRPP